MSLGLPWQAELKAAIDDEIGSVVNLVSSNNLGYTSLIDNGSSLATLNFYCQEAGKSVIFKMEPAAFTVTGNTPGTGPLCNSFSGASGTNFIKVASPGTFPHPVFTQSAFFYLYDYTDSTFLPCYMVLCGTNFPTYAAGDIYLDLAFTSSSLTNGHQYNIPALTFTWVNA